MENAIIIAILVVLVGGAIWYVVKEKKKGTKCIGCPNSGSCSSKGCGCQTDTR
ncbi:MAG: FeoB-associated Cys-rich membrane protein [Lachnospiraceae bacterium]|nr:FeoB-associated Cys-rich membrane protein [Lachnospiraceae bacterium]